MSIFLRLLNDDDKASTLMQVCARYRAGGDDFHIFEVPPAAFDSMPGKPFAYWVSEAVRQCFVKLPAFETADRKVLGGLKTLSDERFLRCWWEVSFESGWSPIAKGGAYSPFYSDVPLVVNWKHRGEDISWYGYQKRPREGFGASSRGVNSYGLPGITWGRRTQVFGPRLLPSGCIFSDKGPAAFCPNVDPMETEAVCALMLSAPFGALIATRLNAADSTARSFEVGVIQKTPLPTLSPRLSAQLATFARRAWSAKRTLDTIEETSHAFVLPATLRARVGEFDPPAIEAVLSRIQTEIDTIAFDLYGFSDADRAAVQGDHSAVNEDDAAISGDDEGDGEDHSPPIDLTAGLLSWAVGVAFGRFDWRLATGERKAPAEPEPFAPLPAKSSGMLSDGAAPFHTHPGILVDDQGHPHDLARLIEEVCARVEVPVPEDVRRWLQRDFFPFHLQRYSKSRRKAPIYWPLSTTSGSYTLWVYYLCLTSQTLYTAINDFVEPKLKQVGADVMALRNKGPLRTREDERQFESLQAFELELIELRDTLLKIAPTFRPSHDDGVQISAAPLWPLFRYKSWQRLLTETWAKLENGDYDWSHLSMNYWPERVRGKCKADKSLAIAHGLEHLYVEPEAQPRKTRGRKKAGGDE
ncbi:MAG: type II restriction endonuclease subunit M [Rhodocyclaceae bacterium]|nr:type II restriction endonuclease subunit M [Rhodocyclaceae bacterium]